MNVARILSDETTTFEQAEAMHADGWVMLWDSAPSEFDGAKYAFTHYGAVIE